MKCIELGVEDNYIGSLKDKTEIQANNQIDCINMCSNDPFCNSCDFEKTLRWIL